MIASDRVKNPDMEQTIYVKQESFRAGVTKKRTLRTGLFDFAGARKIAGRAIQTKHRCSPLSIVVPSTPHPIQKSNDGLSAISISFMSAVLRFGHGFRLVEILTGAIRFPVSCSAKTRSHRMKLMASVGSKGRRHRFDSGLLVQPKDSSVVEQMTFNHHVAGSNPAPLRISLKN